MNPLRRPRPEKTGVRAPLGDLEAAVMRHVWDYGEKGCLVSDVQKALKEAGRPLALTTLLTTLDRLHDKQIVTRQRDGKAFRYRAALSEEALQQRIVSGILGDLIARFPQAVALYFAQTESGNGEPSPELAAFAARLAALRDAPTNNESK